MLSKKQKIKRSEFPKDLKHQKTYNSQHISLTILNNINNKTSKFSIVVSSKKVSKSAVKRNLLKRRGYYIINKNKSKIKPEFTCLLFFKKGANLLDYKKTEEEILFLFKKADLFIV